MQSSAFTLSTSISLSSSRNLNSVYRHSPLSLPLTSTINFHHVNGKFHHRPSPIFYPSYSPRKLGNWISTSSPVSEREQLQSDGFEVKATSVSDSHNESHAPAFAKSNLLEKILLGSLFGLWYLFSIYFNIYNNQVLKVFPNPITITTVQFAVGSVIVFLIWTFNLHKRPKVTGSQLVAILPLAMMHTLGNLFTNISLGKVAVSCNLAFKAMEPFFCVILSAMFLGETPKLWVVGSLFPIVGGVAIASLTEFPFNWAGFWSVMALNLTNQSRNVLSKKFMLKKEGSLDNITLFSIITIMSFFLLAPFTFFTQGVNFTPAYFLSMGLNVKHVYINSLIAAICFHAYNQVSYMILQRVSPVTHSIGICLKRVVVIVTSIFLFQTPVSPMHSFGTEMAISGLIFYYETEHFKPKTA